MKNFVVPIIYYTFVNVSHVDMAIGEFLLC